MKKVILAMIVAHFLTMGITKVSLVRADEVAQEIVTAEVSKKSKKIVLQ